VIKYIGSKRLLIPLILETISRVARSGTVIDLFSGTSRVGHALKGAGYRVLSNDHNAYAATLGRCYVQADWEDHGADVQKLVREFNALRGSAGYFTETFCEKSRFFQPKNGARVDAIREAIAAKGLDPELESILLVSLMEAADRVDSTTGVQMAYLKKWAARSFNDLELRVPEVLPRAKAGKSEAHQLDALEAAERLDAEIAYLDPPYNQHKYLGNYHIWESLVLWDKPEVYGVACKRVDCRDRSSAFNSKPQARLALQDVFRKIRAPHLVVSFSNEGYFGREEMESLLSEREFVFVISQDFKRYVGAQIGIHNLKGEKVGQVSHLRNTEYLYIATSDPEVAARVEPFCDRIGALSSSKPDAPKTESSPLLPLFLSKEWTSAALQEELRSDATGVRTALAPLLAAGWVEALGVRRGTRYRLTAAGEAVLLRKRNASGESPEASRKRQLSLPLGTS
jgi:adenine-specific DNA-methyltransferase